MKATLFKDKSGTYCDSCKGGAMFSIPESRIEQAFGHQVYECDKCHAKVKVLPTEGK
jgi:hypothetical protein